MIIWVKTYSTRDVALVFNKKWIFDVSFEMSEWKRSVFERIITIPWDSDFILWRRSIFWQTISNSSRDTWHSEKHLNACLQRTVKHQLSVPRSKQVNITASLSRFAKAPCTVCHIFSKEMKYQSIGYRKQVIGHTMNVLQLTPKPFKVRCRFFLPNHARDIFQYPWILVKEISIFE